MKEIVKNLLTSKVDHLDAIIAKMESNKNTVEGMTKGIVEKDKKGEDTTEEFNTQSYLLVENNLLQQDLTKVLDTVSVFYNLAKSVGVDEELPKELVTRLDYISEQDSHFFIVNKGEVTFRDKNVEKAVRDRIKEKSKSNFETFMSTLRDSDMYKEEDKDGEEGA